MKRMILGVSALCLLATSAFAGYTGDYKKVFANQGAVALNSDWCGGTVSVDCRHLFRCEVQVRDSLCSAAKLYLSDEGFNETYNTVTLGMYRTSGYGYYARYGADIRIDLNKVQRYQANYGTQYYFNMVLLGRDGKYEKISPNFGE